jgi:hypothetical protein
MIRIKIVQIQGLKKLKCKNQIFLLLLFGLICCNSSNQTIEKGAKKMFYCFGNESLDVFKIVEDSISKYNFNSEIFSKNIAHINKLKKIDEEVFKLNVDGKELILRPIEIQTSEKFPNIDNSYWYFTNGEHDVWYKFITKKNELAYYSKESNRSISYNPEFYVLNSYNSFGRFNLLRIHGYTNPLYLITKIRNDTLGLIEMNETGRKLDLIKYNTSLHKNMIGIWNLKNNTIVGESDAFTSFELFKDNKGQIKNGFYKNDSIYYFVGLNNTNVFFFIDNEELADKITEFTFNKEKPNTIFTYQNPDKIRYEFVKK